jgi:excisionase family DNA binding protein
MNHNLFIQIPRDEFNTQLEAMVQKAVKNGMRNQSQFQLVTIEELMETLKVTKMSIHNWRKEGWLPYYKLGSSVRFNLEDVMKAIEQHNHQKGKRTNKKNLSA